MSGFKLSNLGFEFRDLVLCLSVGRGLRCPGLGGLAQDICDMFNGIFLVQLLSISSSFALSNTIKVNSNGHESGS